MMFDKKLQNDLANLENFTFDLMQFTKVLETFLEKNVEHTLPIRERMAFLASHCSELADVLNTKFHRILLQMPA